MNMTLNLDLAKLYQELDDAGKEVMLKHLTAGMGEGLFRAALIASWSQPISEPNNGEKPGLPGQENEGQ